MTLVGDASQLQVGLATHWPNELGDYGDRPGRASKPSCPKAFIPKNQPCTGLNSACELRYCHRPLLTPGYPQPKWVCLQRAPKPS